MLKFQGPEDTLHNVVKRVGTDKASCCTRVDQESILLGSTDTGVGLDVVVSKEDAVIELFEVVDLGCEEVYCVVSRQLFPGVVEIIVASGFFVLFCCRSCSCSVAVVACSACVVLSVVV